jgi:archaemetzincin
MFEAITHTVQQTFGREVLLHNNALNVSSAYDTSRRQHNSSILLAQLLTNGIQEQTKTIAVVDVDLYVPVLTYVFGEAQFNGHTAIVSLHRLANQFYGLRKNEHLMLERLEKEIIHELGHTFGLYHCRNFECVMRSSTYVEEIDLKRSTFCTECSALIELIELQH